MIFVGILFMGTGTPIPFFDSQEENEIEFSFSGQSTSLHFEPSESPSNNGWAVYSFGQYSDEDEDGIWDDCGIVEISLSDNSEGDFFYLQCDNSTQREEIADMIYVGQMCFDPTNESSPRCNEGNYSLESNVYVKLVQEFGQDDDQPLFSRILEWLVDGLATGRTILCSSFPLLILSIFLSFTLSDEEAEPPTRLSSATTAEWRAYSLSGIPRRRKFLGNQGKEIAEEESTSPVGSTWMVGQMKTPMPHTRKRSRIAARTDDHRKIGSSIRKIPTITIITTARRRKSKMESRTMPLYGERPLPT